MDGLRVTRRRFSRQAPTCLPACQKTLTRSTPWWPWPASGCGPWTRNVVPFQTHSAHRCSRTWTEPTGDCCTKPQQTFKCSKNYVSAKRSGKDIRKKISFSPHRKALQQPANPAPAAGTRKRNKQTSEILKSLRQALRPQGVCRHSTDLSGNWPLEGPGRVPIPAQCPQPKTASQIPFVPCFPV